MSEKGYHKQINQNIRDEILAVLKNYTIQGKRQSLIISNPTIVSDVDADDLSLQKKLKLQEKSLGVPVAADIKLIDNATGKIIDKQRQRILNVPVMTPRNSFIQDGTEYQSKMQLRLKPSVYTRVKENGELESQFNLERGSNFSLTLDPEQSKVMMELGTSSVNVYPIMKMLGITDSQLEKNLGKDLVTELQRQEEKTTTNAAEKMYEYFTSLPPENPKDAEKWVKAFFTNTKMDPAVTKITLGDKFDSVTPQALLAAVKKLVSVSRGEMSPDNRENMIFKKTLDVVDILRERVTKKLRNYSNAPLIKYKVDRAETVDSALPKGDIRALTDKFFLESGLVNSTEQTNPLSMLESSSKVTITGEGGITNSHAITEDARLIHDSQMGLLDPIHTPSSNLVGAVVGTSTGAKKVGSSLALELIDSKNGKIGYKTPEELVDTPIGLPDQFSQSKSGVVKAIGRKVYALVNNKVTATDSKDVRYYMSDPRKMFGLATNLMPYASSNHANRAQMSSKLMEQATSLVQRDAPLVETVAPGGIPYVDTLGEQFSFHAPASGEVTKVNKEFIEVTDKSGQKHKVTLYDNFPLNRQSDLTSFAKVEVGQKVKEGELLADTNFTSNGKLALGKTMTIAYLPYKGLTYEDGIVVSESGAKKLTSRHTHKVSQAINSQITLNKDKYVAYFPKEFTAEQLMTLDEQGVVREGTKVSAGDPLILTLVSDEFSEEAQMLRKFKKALVSPFKNISHTWESSFPGTVTNVAKTAAGINVYVTAEQPVVVGDKLVSSHANKGIVTAVVPDDELPRTAEGTVPDILYSPLSIPSRVNPSQMLEIAAGKIAQVDGTPYQLQNFSGKNYIKELIAELKKKKIKIDEVLYDAKTGKPVGETLIGPQYTFKLHHVVENKLSSRFLGGYDLNSQPTSPAQNFGMHDMHALLAYGMKKTLKEMATYKSERNDEFWRNFQVGGPLPKPQPSFAFDKLVSYLKVLGVNTAKNNDQLVLMPLSDKDILKESHGAINDNMMVKGKNLEPMKQGLFDENTTGGLGGKNWAHIPLNEAIVNPVYAQPIAHLLNLTKNDLEAVIGGERHINQVGELVTTDTVGAMTGSVAVKRALDYVEKNTDMKELQNQASNAKGSLLNKLHRKLRYLTALKEVGLKASEAYMVNNVPVLPPIMRPIFPMDDGSVRVSSLNYLYRDLIMANKQLKDTKHLPQELIGELRLELYKAFKALQGLGTPITKLPTRDIRGVMQLVAGTDQAKNGFIQSVVFKRPQELSGRSTITLGLNMHPDEVGIPEIMAWDIFKPFVIKELVSMGRRPNEAIDMVEKKDPVAKQVLDVVSRDRLVLASRAPVLHQYGYQSFKPIIHSGKDIKVHPLVMAGFNADLDGDCCIDAVFISINKKNMKDLTSALSRSKVEVETWIAERSITMPANVNLPLLDGEVLLHVNLEDFPRIPDSAETTEKGTINYKVPAGVKIITVDSETCNPVSIPVTEFSIHPDLISYHVTTSDGSSLWVSEDHSLVAYDLESFSIVPVKPSELKGRALPKVKHIHPEPVLEKIPVTNFAALNVETQTIPEVNLTEEFGHLLGMLIGDGWVSVDTSCDEKYRRIHIANVSPAIVRAFDEGIAALVTKKKKMYTKGSPHTFDGFECYSEKHTVTSVALAGNFERWIGTGAKNKHLPPWYLPTPEEFRLGLLAGLVDTDGSCYWAKAAAKNTKQLQTCYSTISPRLAQEIVTLCRSLGVRASITHNGKEYRVNISSTDVHKLKLNLRHEDRSAVLAEFQNTPISEQSEKYQMTKYDQIPFGPSLFEIAKRSLKEGMRKKDKDKKQACLYAIAHKSVKTGTIPRRTARELIVLSNGYPRQWVELVYNEAVTWVTAKTVTKDTTPVTMYDITAPGPYTFMTSSGIVIQDTFSIHAPVTPEVLQDTAKALPSRNLISPRAGDLMMAVDKEAALGLYKLTDTSNAIKSDLKYDSLAQLTRDLRDGLLHGNELVKLNGKEVMVGKAVVTDLLGVDKLPDQAMSKKMINAILKKMALKKDPKYADKVNDLEHIGFEAAWRINGGMKFSDLAVFSDVKDKEMPSLMKNVNQMTSRKAADTLRDGIEKILSGQVGKLIKSKNSIYEMMASGARGNSNQFKQMVLAPGFTIDAKNRVIPVPVTSSYAEGLPFHQYWSAMHGGRKGTVETQLATAGPGELYKQALNSLEAEVITINDCHTTEGVVERITSPDVTSKYLAQDVVSGGKTYARRGDVLTTERIEQLTKAGIETVLARSPIFCKAEEGICATCYGLDQNGGQVKVGTHVGVIAAHSLTEPLTQMMLSSKHTGGVYTGAATQFTGIKTIKSLLTLPRVFPDKATLSKIKGKVEQILANPAGGWNVFVDGKKHFSLTEPMVKPGDSVGRGDPLSRGILNPRDVLELKGVDSVKRYLVQKIKELYKDGGTSVSSKHIEVLSKAMSNVSRVVEPGGSEFLPGDIVPTTKIRYYNRNRMVEGDPVNFVGGRLAEDVGKFKSGTLITPRLAEELKGKVTKVLQTKIKYKPELSGVNMLPLANSEWLSRLNYTHLKDTIMDGAAMRWKTHLHGINPIPAYMYGAEFGDPGDDSPQY